MNDKAMTAAVVTWLVIGVFNLLDEKARYENFNILRESEVPFLSSSIFLALFVDLFMMRLVVCGLVYIGVKVVF
jgi:hypothetical protein